MKKHIVLSVIFILGLIIILSGCIPKDTSITITFNENGGENVNDINTHIGEMITLPPTTKVGFEFQGWFDDANTLYSTQSQFDQSITLHAKWEIAQFTVSFVDFDNSIINKQTIKYGKSAIAPDIPNRSGYVFTNWNLVFDKVYNDLTITAQYERATDGLIYELDYNNYNITAYLGTDTEVIIPSHYHGLPVTRISNKAFNQALITKITLPNTITEIGDNAFYSNINLTDINIPTSVQVIGKNAFYDCRSLRKIVIPTPVIGEGAFYGCSLLSDITLLDTVTTLESYAFYGSADLTSIFIPESVTNIGLHIFSWCQKLQYIYTPASNVDNLTTMIENATLIYTKVVVVAAQ